MNSGRRRVQRVVREGGSEGGAGRGLIGARVAGECERKEQ